VKLNNVLFEVGTTKLLKESFVELDEVVDFLKRNPKVKIELQGHTDNQGSAMNDSELSQQRVDKIRGYLVSQRIKSNRVSGKGFGNTRPIALNSTEEGRRLNRRVEFVIVRK
jgi:outer membrane protein OmpA-like peptidoglycan-associated protein